MNKFFTHVKNLNDHFLDVPFHVAKKGNSHYITVLSSSGYKIYDCRKLNVIFQGPLIGPSTRIGAFNDYTIIYSNNLMFYYRGILAHKSNELLDDFLVFGNYFVLTHKSTIKIMKIEIINEYKINLITIHTIERNSIVKILHPPTYVNKIVILFENTVEIYNVKKQKTVHISKFENCQNAFLTPILDIIALSCGEKIVFYNLKTDNIYFELSCSTDVKHLSFSTSQPLMLSVNKNDFWMYNLEERRVVKKYQERVHHATFLFDEDIIAITTKNSIRLMTIEDLSLKLVKIRKTLENPNIMGITSNKLLLANSHEVHLVDLYKEEQNFMFSIKNYKGADKVYTEGNKIIIYDNSNVYKLDQDNKNGVCIFESYKKNIKDVTISTCGNFGALVTQTNNIVIYNLDSKMIYSEAKKEVDVVRAYIDTFKNAIIIVYAAEIEICDQKFIRSASIKTDRILSTAYIGDFIVISHERTIVFYDVLTTKKGRQFDIEVCVSSFFISDDVSLLTVCTEESILIYDIRTTNLIEEFKNKPDAAVTSLNNEFVTILEGGVVKCFYNNTLFDDTLLLNKNLGLMPIKQRENMKTQVIETFDDLLQTSLVDSFKLLGPEKFNAIISNNLDKIDLLFSACSKLLNSQFEDTQLVLHEILKLTHKSISFDTAKSFYDQYAPKFDKLFAEYTKAVAYSKFEELSLE